MVTWCYLVSKNEMPMASRTLALKRDLVRLVNLRFRSHFVQCYSHFSYPFDQCSFYIPTPWLSQSQTRGMVCKNREKRSWKMTVWRAVLKTDLGFNDWECWWLRRAEGLNLLFPSFQSAKIAYFLRLNERIGQKKIVFFPSQETTQVQELG